MFGQQELTCVFSSVSTWTMPPTARLSMSSALANSSSTTRGSIRKGASISGAWLPKTRLSSELVEPGRVARGARPRTMGSIAAGSAQRTIAELG